MLSRLIIKMITRIVTNNENVLFYKMSKNVLSEVYF